MFGCSVHSIVKCYKSLLFFRKHYRVFQVPEIVLVVYICKMVFKVSQSGK